VAYAALIRGLFSSNSALAAAEKLVAGCTTEDDILAAKEALMASGYDAEVYGTPVGDLADQLFEIAAAELAPEEAELLEPLAALVASRTTLASQY